MSAKSININNPANIKAGDRFRVVAEWNAFGKDSKIYTAMTVSGENSNKVFGIGCGDRYAAELRKVRS